MISHFGVAICGQSFFTRSISVAKNKDVSESVGPCGPAPLRPRWRVRSAGQQGLAFGRPEECSPRRSSAMRLFRHGKTYRRTFHPSGRAGLSPCRPQRKRAFPRRTGVRSGPRRPADALQALRELRPLPPGSTPLLPPQEHQGRVRLQFEVSYFRIPFFYRFSSFTRETLPAKSIHAS